MTPIRNSSEYDFDSQWPAKRRGLAPERRERPPQYRGNAREACKCYRYLCVRLEKRADVHVCRCRPTDRRSAASNSASRARSC